MSAEKIARIRIFLTEIEPTIWRRVDVPLGMSLKGLHDVIQAAGGPGIDRAVRRSPVIHHERVRRAGGVVLAEGTCGAKAVITPSGR